MATRTAPTPSTRLPATVGTGKSGMPSGVRQASSDTTR